jgi:NAD(P)-dependent dehydrogenase (short-subunit alcohol dehydrogenase family)
MSGILSSQVALVCGASRGLGRAIALHLAAAGAAVAVMARSEAELESLAEEIRARGGSALAAMADVTDRAQVESAIAQVGDVLGPVTVLVNSAGRANPYGPVGVADPDAWWRTQEIHVRGTLLPMSVVIPCMRARGGGRIINISSRGGIEVMPNLSAYCVAKATQIRLSEHVDAEQREHGIRVFAIQPGTIITEMARQSLADPDAARWAPFLVEGLRELLHEDPAPKLARLGEFVVALAAGRHDALAGRYLDIDADLAAITRAAQEGEP